jgi:hypothetical protein
MRVQTECAELSVMTTRADRVARLAMDARHHLERRDLYRTKVNSPDAASPARLHVLERDYAVAAERLRAAEAADEAAPMR